MNVTKMSGYKMGALYLHIEGVKREKERGDLHSRDGALLFFIDFNVYIEGVPTLCFALFLQQKMYIICVIMTQ